MGKFNGSSRLFSKYIIQSRLKSSKYRSHFCHDEVFCGCHRHHRCCPSTNDGPWATVTRLWSLSVEKPNAVSPHIDTKNHDAIQPFPKRSNIDTPNTATAQQRWRRQRGRNETVETKPSICGLRWHSNWIKECMSRMGVWIGVFTPSHSNDKWAQPSATVLLYVRRYGGNGEYILYRRRLYQRGMRPDTRWTKSRLSENVGSLAWRYRPGLRLWQSWYVLEAGSVVVAAGLMNAHEFLS